MLLPALPGLDASWARVVRSWTTFPVTWDARRSERLKLRAISCMIRLTETHHAIESRKSTDRPAPVREGGRGRPGLRVRALGDSSSPARGEAGCRGRHGVFRRVARRRPGRSAAQG